MSAPRRHAAHAGVAAAALVAGLLAGGEARAQIFSPGALSKAHASLDGVAQCGKCHADGARHDDTRCTACHEEIQKREAKNQGYHARVAARSCAECHREHRGASASLITWPVSKQAFNHGQTGWPLVGAHKKNACNKCHEPRRIEDDDARALAKKGRETFLGLGSACKSCHFDEHRGQEGARCETCHSPADGASGPEAWRRAAGFNHNKDARFPLTGQHRKVACTKCHSEETDEAAPANAFPKPRDDTYLQMKGIAFASCVACHDDPHRGQFGKGCASCHTTDGWRVIKQTAQDQGFHDKTDFPLRGEHTSVACKTCHGPFPGERAVFKGLPHQYCADCHVDAHAGQLADEETKRTPDCNACHDVTGFLPVKVDAAMHDTFDFPLRGSHTAVACTLCHVSDARIGRRMPDRVRRELDRKGRRVLASGVKLAFTNVERCDTCHRDPHAGQFDERKGGCASCHQVESFTKTTFDHDESRFPLTGKHEKVDCNKCHGADPSAKKRSNVIMYKPLDTECSACHADEHVGQLADNGVTACARCHVTDGFKPATKFDHQKSAFPLEGKHAKVKCASCHPSASLAGGDEAARYKPMPTACADCHEDEHKGRYDKFKPSQAATRAAAGSKEPVGCAACHAPTGFLPAAFAHERTSFALQGKHRGAACASCHGSDTARPVPQSCAACHTDPHLQEFGLSCGGCHDEQTFRAPRFAVDSHRRSAFPLVGRHAALPCEECHVDKRDRVFTRAALDCASCHARDATRATLVNVNHQRAPFNQTCNGCHEPVAFTPARFPGHEACFPIARSVHSGVRCAECHTRDGLRGAAANGSCAGVPVRCAECHVHAADVEARNHAGVAGYEHQSEKCAGCHRALPR